MSVPTLEDMQRVAFRAGEPQDWGKPERWIDILYRILSHFQLEYEPPGARELAALESNRQANMFNEKHLKFIVEEQRFITTWEPVARLLTKALKHPDDPRSDGEVIEMVFDALRIVDQQINRRLNQRDPFRPIG